MMRYFKISALLIAFWAIPAYAADDPCDKIMSKFKEGVAGGGDCNRHLSFNSSAIQKCILRGWDAPQTCRKNGGKSDGVDVGGSSGFNYGVVQPPDHPPALAGAPPSVSTTTMKVTMGPSTSWDKCHIGSIDICHCTVSIAGQDINYTGTPACPKSGAGSDPVQYTGMDTSCDVAVDSTYGIHTALSAGVTPSLPCGGAIPMTAYTLILNISDHTPIYMASTEYSSYYLNIYKQNGNTLQLVKGNIRLPTYLCNKNGRKSVDLPPADAQIMLYDSRTNTMMLKLMPRYTLYTTITNPIPPYDPNTENNPINEKYLVLPLDKNGVPKPLYNCARDTDYYKPFTAFPSMGAAGPIIQSAVNPSCDTTVPQVCISNTEGCPVALTNGQCCLNGSTLCGNVPSVPTPEQSCDFASIDLTGSCAGKTQFISLDRPNIVYPPGATPKMLGIKNLSYFLTPTLGTTAADSSRIYVQAGTIVKLPTRSTTLPAITLPEGGAIQLGTDGTSLKMNGPATIDMVHQSVTLTNGGIVTSNTGNLIQSYNNGEIVSLTQVANTNMVPITINRSFTLPTGYYIPTRPKSGTWPAYVQMPITK